MIMKKYQRYSLFTSSLKKTINIEIKKSGRKTDGKTTEIGENLKKT